MHGRRVAGRRGAGRRVAVTLLAAALVLGALVIPRGVSSPAAFLRIPVEALLAVALLLVLPARPRRVVAGVLGALLGLLTVLALVDTGFHTVLARPFDPVVDGALLGDAVGFLSGSFGAPAAAGAVVGAVVLAVAVPVLVTLAVLRLSRVVVRRRNAATRAVAVLVPAWLACALLGAQIVPGVPVAAASAADLVRDTVVGVPASLRDRHEFAAQIAVDPFGDIPGDALLGALRGKDVVVAFVESHGRYGVEDPGIGAVLDDGTRRLDAAGFASRSGFLTSPIVGGGSWLAHATFGSGLRIDDQQRYRTLMASDRRTLSSAFRDAGHRTVAVMPGTTQAWPEQEFYGFDRLLDFAALGYRGPDLGWGTVPDQFTLSAFARLDRTTSVPIMAEIALVSSHTPWEYVPPLLGWDDLGDGSVYRSLAATGAEETGAGETGAGETGAGETTGAAYRRSIEYSLRSLVSFVRTHGDDDLVLLVLGDHQPLPAVTGEGAGRDVPISIVTRDPAVLDRISGWGWQAGLRPGPQAPVWPMEDFRDRFLTAFAR
ncbi:MAG: sulfatase [Pseudonocardia sp.]|nr:sulfatase [Pseudonocardia sp.]